MLKFYHVYHISDTEGINSKIQVNKSPNSYEEEEKIIEDFKNKPEILRADPNRCYYDPKKDFINVPDKNYMRSTEEYFSALYHETIHSTGHELRLKREGITEPVNFGSKIYAMEELIAEIGSAMLCNISGVDKVIENQSSYIHGWLKVLENDTSLIFKASSFAQRAFDYVLNNVSEQVEEDQDEKEEEKIA